MRYNSFNYRNLALCIWIFLFFLTPDICFCESLAKVVSTSPSWSSFTNPDGTGLYHEIIDEIFTPLGIKVSHEYSNAARGIIMVEKGLADFYIDDQTLINESLSRTTLPFNRNDLKIEPVGKRTYHPVFKDSKRGNQILGIYEQGMEKLHQSGRLKAIFKKWNHPYPDYDAQSAVH